MKPIALLTPALGTPNIGDHFIELAIRRLLGEEIQFQRFSIRRPLSREDLSAIDSCRCALLCGTNLYQHDWESALTAADVASVGVPVIPFGVGGSARELGDTHVSQKTRTMIAALHSRCAVGGVRDPFSLRVVEGAAVHNALLTGCPVLFWSGAEDLPPIRSIPRRRVVVTARNWLMHQWPDNIDNPVQLQFLRTVLTGLSTNEFIYVAHEELDERLIEPLGIPSESVFRGSSPGDYIDLYSNPEHVVLAMRLHAGMLALANGVPTLFIGHDTRTYSFCEMMGLQHVELFCDTAAQETVERLRRILAGEVSEFASAADRYRRLLAAMQIFLERNELPSRGFSRGPRPPQ